VTTDRPDIDSDPTIRGNARAAEERYSGLGSAEEQLRCVKVGASHRDNRATDRAEQ
jgi:hypothetical protein